MKSIIFFAFLLALVSADIYCHSPATSNNRNRETNTNRNNANRLFDSQNNGKGGYCWAPTSTYYEGSFLQVEWTNQHGCGSTHSNVDCDIVLQYMCDATLRDGTTTNTIPFVDDDPNAASRDEKDANGEFVYGMHESYEYFRKCDRRKRNKGLFYADQNDPDNVNKNARYTRQGNDQTRYGFECPEERDYYPYWHPSPWKDIVIYTSNTARCNFMQENSQNFQDKWWCTGDENDSNDVEQYETEDKCIKGDGTWTQVTAWNIPKPECYEAGWNRDNHLGNGPGGYSNSYKWVLPAYSILKDQEIEDLRDGADGLMVVPCVFRIRYNISSGDYRGGVENTGTTYEGDNALGVGGFADHNMNGAESPVKQDPYIEYGKHPENEETDLLWHLKLAINTNQFARTFEERSHVFYMRARTDGGIGNIFNILVRGKRGNIVQTYPAVEYDFSPNDLKMKVGEYIHFHVGGCDFNPAGNDGEGTDSYDRSNMVQIGSGSFEGGRGNYPVQFEKVSMWGTPNTRVALERTWTMAFLDQYDRVQCQSQTDTNCCYTLEQLMAKHQNANDRDEDLQNCSILNGEGANGFDSGLVQMTEAGTFHYMSSRNNNFTNRSQKAILTVGGMLSVPTLVALAAGGGAAVTAGVISVAVWSGSGSCLSTVSV